MKRINLKHVTAQQIMTQDTLAVETRTPIYDAVRILVERGISGLPVVDADLKLVGILTEKDVLQLLRERPSSRRFVEDYMTRDVVSFQEDTDLTAIAECLQTHHFRRVPITTDGKLAGIISRRDIIRFILLEEGKLRSEA
ncbi:MAG: CBS domain-containing protein [Candidatus Hydrogenedentes bacterium]|nr:CBS domain-containing protein [Candidatus Hydrogenedentota bacterium]